MIDVPDWCAEAWGAMQALGNLGFTGADLFIEAAHINPIGWAIAVVLRPGPERSAVREFVWTIAPLKVKGKGEAAEALKAAWPPFIRDMNDATDAEREAIFRQTAVGSGRFLGYVALARAIAEKGITVPKLGALGALLVPPAEGTVRS